MTHSLFDSVADQLKLTARSFLYSVDLNLRHWQEEQCNRFSSHGKFRLGPKAGVMAAESSWLQRSHDFQLQDYQLRIEGFGIRDNSIRISEEEFDYSGRRTSFRIPIESDHVILSPIEALFLIFNGPEFFIENPSAILLGKKITTVELEKNGDDYFVLNGLKKIAKISYHKRTLVIEILKLKINLTLS